MVDKVIKHYGTPRRSGRYPWGSGDTPYQHNANFINYIRDLKKQGMSEVEIAKGLGMNTSELRKKRSIALAEKRAADARMALKLREKGYSLTAIGERMGINESSVRSLLDPALREKAKITAATADVLKSAIDEKKYIDIGAGMEVHLGVSKTKLNTAVKMLEEQGYVKYYVKVPQVGTGKFTTLKVLVPPDTPYSEVYKNRDQISMVTDYSDDGGRTFFGLKTPVNVSSNRIMIRYGDDGGSLKDGVIELRRGVDDISLGDKHYAQVRVAVDGTHFMKGMAMYGDIPDGFDIVYNTNKQHGTPVDDVFKPMKDDPDNPFGASIRQKYYIDSEGNKKLSALNIVGSAEGAGEEGAWREWSKSLSSQVLSKQAPALAKKQLGIALDLQQEEFDEIMSLTNPAVKKALLKPFSDECDSEAVHLKAAALPRQANHVILPIDSLRDDEVYAPNYKNGEVVVLIRHPHGGIFEIPEVKVNNRNPEARSLLGNAEDAIGINSKVAARLSGADFDGDAVLVIPNKNRNIKTSAPIKGLMEFDPKTAYPEREGMRLMSEPQKQREMGKVSNLITDMTIKGADPEEIARAVRHSMVVIDAVKHKLDYESSYVENGIPALKKKYQGKSRGGAATIVSRAKSPKRIDEVEEGKYVTDPKTGKKKKLYIDPDTGEYLYTKTGRVYPERKKIVDPKTGDVTYVETGKMIKATTKTTRMAYVKDAHKLSSGTTMEGIYADHANALKDMANKARLAMLRTKDIPYSRAARETYAKEVSSLKAALRLAYRNKPLERQALLLANKVIEAKRKANPEMTPAELKKVKSQALNEARNRYGAKKQNIKISDREWEAIQAGALSSNALSNILANSDLDALKQRAMPRYRTSMSPARTARARAMEANGYTRAEIADAIGVSVNTIADALKGK